VTGEPNDVQHAGRPWRWLLAVAAVVLLAGAGALYYVETLHSVSTDDASVQADIVAVMAKVPGYVEALHVDDNSPVQRMQKLLEIDARDYVLQVDAARTALDAAESKLAEARAQIAAAAADVAQDKAEVATADASSRLATDILNRRLRLNDLSISAENKDTARANADSAAGNLAAAQLKVTAAETRGNLAEVQAKTAQVGVAQAMVALDQAALNLSYTKIVSAVDGTVANRSVVVGNYVQPGQLLLSLVPNKIYVVANFKETQIAGVDPGRPATVRIDALRGETFKAHVDSLQRGTGATFALLPAENATGNFVKVVQRIPVKLVFDEPPDRVRLVVPGMSVVVRVDTQ